MSLFRREPEPEPDPKIEFLIENQYKNIFPEPVEAKSMLPDWYKKMDRWHDPGEGQIVGTMKACPPMLDLLTAGYIIPFPVQLTVRAKNPQDVNIHWRGEFHAVSTHSHEQIKGSPFERFKAFKFHNPWTVRTPPGYSVLFTNPLNHGPKPYTLFSAIVDTDVWNVPTNFPFIWTRYPFSDVIDEGMPMVQVIPFKRENWHGGVRVMDEDEAQEFYAEGERVFTKNRHYRNNRRQKKSHTLRDNEPQMPADEIHLNLRGDQ